MGLPRSNRRPWYLDPKRRMRFEGSVRSHFPNLRSAMERTSRNAVYVYRCTIPVEDFPDRKVRVVFNHASPSAPGVFADGPEDSPHRYRNGSLCIWYPRDPSDKRWVFEDGLCHLLGLAELHLFKEAWWRLTREASGEGEWLGDSVPHGPVDVTD